MEKLSMTFQSNNFFFMQIDYLSIGQTEADTIFPYTEIPVNRADCPQGKDKGVSGITNM